MGSSWVDPRVLADNFGDRLVDIEPQPVCWLWPDRIARKLVLFTGPPDFGKTNTAIDIAARVTTGNTWPDGCGRAPLGSVIVMTAEDGLADTIRTMRLPVHPRIE